MVSLSNIIHNVDRVNEFQYRNNAFAAKYSTNPEEKKLAEARYYCKNQLTFRSLKLVFVAVLLPILLLILIIYFGSTNWTLYKGLGVWVVGGLGYTVYRSGVDTKIEWDINHSNVTKEDCGF
jgi:hypothetical protein